MVLRALEAGREPHVAAGLAGRFVATKKGGEFRAREISREPHELQPNDLRSRALLEVAVNGVSDHFLQGIERVRLGVDGLAERSGLEAALNEHFALKLGTVPSASSSIPTVFGSRLVTFHAHVESPVAVLSRTQRRVLSAQHA